MENTATSFDLLNYSGMLFCRGNVKTPFSTMIGGKSREAKGWKFHTSLGYDPGGGTSQPAISEAASVKAPEPNHVGRTPNSNVCQIFQDSVSITYGKLSSQEQLSGVNLAGAAPNPASEIDFQVAQTMIRISKDIEYTFLNGVYQESTDKNTPYKTRGILNAIESNVITAGGNGLTYWQVARLHAMISGAGGNPDGLVLMANPIHILQFNGDAKANGLTVVENSRNINGINVTSIMTPTGLIGIAGNYHMPVGQTMLFDPAICAPAMLPVPKKGNFFLEPLAKSGASEDYQIYGQAGLDYGAEWYHGKITGLATEFDETEYQRKVYVTGGTLNMTTAAAASEGE